MCLCKSHTTHNLLKRIPLLKYSAISSTETLKVGCNRGPVTSPGLIVTMSILFSSENFQAASSAKVFERKYHNFFDSQYEGSEYQVSSTTTSGVSGVPLKAMATIDNIKITRLIEVTFAQDLRTFSVPSIAGLINSAWITNSSLDGMTMFE
uniref:Uncharacterized protein MANES_S060300 n=2 Tax=Rhizophora mucronata TaxID=61149 RepID=A0A2P2J9K3_RHIMU